MAILLLEKNDIIPPCVCISKEELLGNFVCAESFAAFFIQYNGWKQVDIQFSG